LGQNSSATFVAEFEKTTGTRSRKNTIRGRRAKAGAFIDSQIRTIIQIIKDNGGSMSYGSLFKATQDKFDALSGLLHTGKKRGIFDFHGEMLMQGQDDEVKIKVLKEDMEDTQVFHSVILKPEEVAAMNAPKSMGPESCYQCGKTVFPTERIAPNSKPMHKACFKCDTCNSRLDAYALNDGTFYCQPCYTKPFMATGKY